jgi:hypothetical protein
MPNPTCLAKTYRTRPCTNGPDPTVPAAPYPTNPRLNLTYLACLTPPKPTPHT